MAYQLVTRFAPSPTGFFHLGHVLSMAYVFGLAENLNAKVILRIEDHDVQRCLPQYTKAMLEDMEWLGFNPDAIFQQSADWQKYHNLASKLEDLNLVYRCNCSRKQIQESNTYHIISDEQYYGGYCREKKLNDSHTQAKRILMPDQSISFNDLIQGYCEQNPSKQCGDVLIIDRYGYPTYNFAVVVDDILQGVNLIIRGVDLLPCTARQICISKYLQRTDQPIYMHHPLVTDEQGKKLSKRIMSESISKHRLEGLKPEVMLGEALWRGGLIKHNQEISRSVIPEILAGMD